MKGKLITKTYMSQNKLRFFLTERACTAYRALLTQLRARPVHDSDYECILSQPAKRALTKCGCSWQVFGNFF